MSAGSRQLDGYHLVNLIATSRTSQLWEVSKAGSSTHYAMKLLLPKSLNDANLVHSLKHEAKVTRSLDHPHVIRFVSSKVTSENAYLVLEYFRAPALNEWISKDLAGLHRQIRSVLESTSAAFEHVHKRGWVHKDIKPDNILLNSAGQIKVIDFSVSSKMSGGLSKLLRTKDKVIQGTRTYIAPETIRKERATPQTDIYSLGVTIFEMLTGRPPFLASSPDELLKKHLAASPQAPSELNPNVTPEMDRLVSRMLQKSPEKRPATMLELHGEFRSIRVFKKSDSESSGDDDLPKMEELPPVV